MRIARFGALLGLLGAAACAEIPQATQTGPNILTGRATLVTGGYRRGCEDVLLLPVTPEIEKRFVPFGDLHDNRFIGAFALRRAIADDEIQRLMREVECAGDGGFSFRNLPSGQYLLIARVTWSMRWARHGGYIVQRIAVTTNIDDLDVSVVKDNA